MQTHLLRVSVHIAAVALFALLVLGFAMPAHAANTTRNATTTKPMVTVVVKYTNSFTGSSGSATGTAVAGTKFTENGSNGRSLADFVNDLIAIENRDGFDLDKKASTWPGDKGVYPSKSTTYTLVFKRAGNPVYWILSKSTGENLYTTDKNEVNYWCSKRKTWTNKGIVWYASKTGTPVYRLYHPKLKDHHYTNDAYEVKVLTSTKGWKLDAGKPMWYSNGKARTYRLYNPARAKAGKAGTHRFSTSMAYVNVLKQQGWKLDDVKMYGLSVGKVS